MTSPLHGGDPRFESGRAHRFFFQSGAKIEPEAEGVEDEELHNFSVAEKYSANKTKPKSSTKT
jgi:hypothetical protein